jgi:sialic acid synthase SpsE
MSIKVIAEIGSNWEGDLELAKLHIKKSKESGADYVKFQMWRAEDLYNPDHPEWEIIKKSELTEDIALELKKYADKIGIKWFCSVFYPQAVDFLETMEVPIYKIASRTSTLKDKFSLETIQRVSETKKMTFVSTGEGGDKKKISKIFQPENLGFTYCVSKYPTDDTDINWSEILNYDFFSDHTKGITIPLIYVIMKKSIAKDDIFIEKHTRFEDSKGPDAIFAITYDELKELTLHLKRIEKLTY